MVFECKGVSIRSDPDTPVIAGLAHVADISGGRMQTPRTPTGLKLPELASHAARHEVCQTNLGIHARVFRPDGATTRISKNEHGQRYIELPVAHRTALTTTLTPRATSKVITENDRDEEHQHVVPSIPSVTTPFVMIRLAAI
jgi:hypothetical protein